jgi:hypothetical protein
MCLVRRAVDFVNGRGSAFTDGNKSLLKEARLVDIAAKLE